MNDLGQPPKDPHDADSAEAANYNTDGGVQYTATGKDNKGNRYLITWNTTEEWNNAQIDDEGDPVDSWREDESYACDWDNPESVVLM